MDSDVAAPSGMTLFADWLRERRRSREVRRARSICAKAGHPIDHVSDDEIEERLTLASIREHMRFFGYPVDDMTDAELKESLQRFGEFVGTCGVSADEFARGFGELFEWS